MSPLSNYQSQRSLALVFIATQWLLVAPATQADDSVPLSAKVTSVVGSARYEDKQHPSWTALSNGDQVVVGAVLQTDLRDSSTDIELAGSDVSGQATVHMFSNTILVLTRLGLQTSDSVPVRDIRFRLSAGRVRISLDGRADYAVELDTNDSLAHLTVPRGVAGPQETLFVFTDMGSLTVLKGAVTARVAGKPQTLVRAGEQLLRGAKEVTKTPPEAPELKSGQ